MTPCYHQVKRQGDTLATPGHYKAPEGSKVHVKQSEKHMLVSCAHLARGALQRHRAAVALVVVIADRYLRAGPGQALARMASALPAVATALPAGFGFGRPPS